MCAAQVEAGLQRTQREMEALHKEYCEAMQGLYGEYQERRQGLDAAKQVFHRTRDMPYFEPLDADVSCAEVLMSTATHAATRRA